MPKSDVAIKRKFRARCVRLIGMKGTRKKEKYEMEKIGGGERRLVPIGVHRVRHLAVRPQASCRQLVSAKPCSRFLFTKENLFLFDLCRVIAVWH